MERQRWHQLYEEAVLELDPVKLKERIEVAALAIREREIELRSSGASMKELMMIADARNTLEVLLSTEVRPAHPQTMPRPA